MHYEITFERTDIHKGFNVKDENPFTFYFQTDGAVTKQKILEILNTAELQYIGNQKKIEELREIAKALKDSQYFDESYYREYSYDIDLNSKFYSIRYRTLSFITL